MTLDGGLAVLASKPDGVTLQTFILDIQSEVAPRPAGLETPTKKLRVDPHQRWRSRVIELEGQVMTLEKTVMEKESEITKLSVQKKRKVPASNIASKVPRSEQNPPATSETPTNAEPESMSASKPKKRNVIKKPKEVDGKLHLLGVDAALDDPRAIENFIGGRLSEMDSEKSLGIVSALLELGDSGSSSSAIPSQLLIAPTIKLLDRISDALSGAIGQTKPFVQNPRRLVSICAELLVQILSKILPRLEDGTATKAIILAKVENGVVKNCVRYVYPTNRRKYDVAGNATHKAQFEHNPVREVVSLLHSMLAVRDCSGHPLAELVAVHCTAELANMLSTHPQKSPNGYPWLDRLAKQETIATFLRAVHSALPYLPIRPTFQTILLDSSIFPSFMEAQKHSKHLITATVSDRLLGTVLSAILDPNHSLEEDLSPHLWESLLKLGEALMVLEGRSFAMGGEAAADST